MRQVSRKLPYRLLLEMNNISGLEKMEKVAPFNGQICATDIEKFDTMIDIYNFVDLSGGTFGNADEFCKAFIQTRDTPVSKFAVYYHPIILRLDREFFEHYSISEDSLLNATDARLAQVYNNESDLQWARYSVNNSLKHIAFFLDPENSEDKQASSVIPYCAEKIRLILSGNILEARMLNIDDYKK